MPNDSGNPLSYGHSRYLLEYVTVPPLVPWLTVGAAYEGEAVLQTGSAGSRTYVVRLLAPIGASPPFADVPVQHVRRLSSLGGA
ncbi:MAG: hypothetical protein ABJD11_12955 [Gemmatimonadota bacterium]